MLERYLEDINSRLDSTNDTVLEDVESRIADLFLEELSSPMQVVTADMARRAMARIGRPEDFGDRKTTYNANKSNNKQPLTRSRKDRMIAGVCSGLARYFGVDVSMVRVIAILALIVGTAGFWIYIILVICLPNDDEATRYQQQNERR